jgi:hypothetical protein
LPGRSNIPPVNIREKPLLLTSARTIYVKTLADPRALGEIIDRIDAVGEASQRKWGTMSAHQMLVHVADLAEGAVGRISFPVRRRGKPSKLIKWYGLYVPVRWPHGLKVGLRPAELVLDPHAFAVDRTRAAAACRELGDPAAVTLPTHPLFGSMSRNDWHRWGYLHADHHLRQFGC